MHAEGPLIVALKSAKSVVGSRLTSVTCLHHEYIALQYRKPSINVHHDQAQLLMYMHAASIPLAYCSMQDKE